MQQTMIPQRWSECDALDDPIARIDCRTSRLNDGFHLVHDRLERVEWQQRFLLAGAASAILGGIVTVLRFVHELGAF